MKRLGIISDTHLSETGKRSIPTNVLDLFRGVDFIIHAGDFTARRALMDLEAVAPVVGVRGNNDPAHLQLPYTRRINVEGVVLGLCHGDRGGQHSIGSADQFAGNGITVANALGSFEFEDDDNCLIFGHSHNPLSVWHRHEEREILLFNPGSPTDKRWGPKYGCGILTIDGDQIEPELFLW